MGKGNDNDLQASTDDLLSYLRETGSPFACPLILHVAGQDRKDSLAEITKRTEQLDQDFIFKSQHDRGTHVLDKTLALICRDPLFADYLKAFIDSQQEDNRCHDNELKQKIMNKWRMVPYLIRDLRYFKVRSAPIHPYWPYFTGESPTLLVGGVVNKVPYTTIDVYLNPLDPKSLRAAKGFASAALDRAFQELKSDAVPKEMHFIFSTKNATFWKYVEWYDLHRFDGRSFRDIAYIARVQDSKRREEYAQQLKNKKKPWGGKDVEGEDNVEQGVKLIYLAIDRTPFTRRTKEIDTYNCLEHGNACPESCEYFRRWWADFNNLHSTNKAFAPLSSDLGIDPDAHLSVRRGTKPKAE
jgi:hypothetical protein